MAEFDPISYSKANKVAAQMADLNADVVTHKAAAAPHSGHETLSGAQEKANAALAEAKLYAENVAISSANSALNNASDYTNQVAAEINQRIDETRVKVINVEKNISDISKALTNLNPNQEAKQSISGYGILSLPKNAANGQVSDVKLSGVTRTNLVKSSNMDTDSNADGVVDDFVRGVGSGITAVFSLDGTQKIKITDSTNSSKYAEIKQRYIPIKENDVFSACIDVKISGNVKVDLTVSAYDNNNMWLREIASSPKTTSNGVIKLENLTAPSNTNTVTLALRVFPINAGDTGIVWVKNAMVEKASSIDTYISSGTKSTLSARVKSVGKNLFHPKHALKKPQYSIREYLGVQCLSWVADSSAQYGLFMDGMFEKGKRYIIIADMAVASHDAALLWYYDDGTTQATPFSQTVNSFTRIISTSAAGKNVVGIGGMWNADQRVYVRLDTFQVQKADASQEYEPYMESNTYFVTKDPETDEILQLRSVPSGANDEVRLSEGKLIKRVSDEYKDFSTIWYYDSVYEVFGFTKSDLPNITNNYSVGIGVFYNQDGFSDVNRLYTPGGIQKMALNLPANLLTSKGYTANSVGARQWAIDTELTLIYQLAEPVEIPIEVSGNIVSYPSGTIYIERAVPDAGIYTDKMTVLHQDLPIKVLEKLSKIDFMTGLETELDVSDAIIAGDKLSFTHPDLVDGDIVFFVYEYDRESTEGKTEIEYYDSRYVIKDSATGKFYKWHIAIANGVPSIELTEV